MALIFRIASVIALHVAFFAAYPDTGPYGNYYLAVSLLLWLAFTAFLGTAARALKFLNGPLGGLLNLAAFALMGAALALTMPQQDKDSVLEKLRAGRYPARADLQRGMKRFGVNLNRELDKGAATLEDAAGELKKNAETFAEEAARKAESR